MSLVGQVLGGRYRVLTSIARGGMGTVYEAEDLRLSRRVALKVLLDELADDPTCAERFRREARATASISHPNLVAVHDVSVDTRPAFLVMELVEGETLAARLGREGSLEWRSAVRIARGVLAALECLHAGEIIHRDLKPSNVLILPSGDVKLIDLGVAQLRTGASYARLTQSGAIIGSPAYMAPEQLSGGPMSPKTDLWALGVLLHHMLTGQHPFAAHEMSRLLWSIAHEAPADLRAIAPETPEPLLTLVRRLLSKEGRDRPTSNEVARALDDVLGGKAESAAHVVTLPRPASAAGGEARWDLSIGAGPRQPAPASPESPPPAAEAPPTRPPPAPTDRTQTIRQARSASIVAAAVALVGLLATCAVGVTLTALMLTRPPPPVDSPAVLATPDPAPSPTPGAIQITHRGDDADAATALLTPTLNPVLRACVPDVRLHRLGAAVAVYTVHLRADGSPESLEHDLGVASPEETACIEGALMAARWPPPTGTHVAMVLMMPVM